MLSPPLGGLLSWVLHGRNPLSHGQSSTRPHSSAAELAEAERVQLQRARRLPVAGLYAAVFVSYGGRRQAVDEGQEAAQGHEPAQELHCCGRDCAMLSEATAVSSAARHLVADAS